MKAASEESFSVHSKHKKFPGLLLVFVWHVAEPSSTVTYAMTIGEAMGIARAVGFTKTRAWQNGTYSCTTISDRLRVLLEPFRTPDKWQTRVRGCLESGPA